MQENNVLESRIDYLVRICKNIKSKNNLTNKIIIDKIWISDERKKRKTFKIYYLMLSVAFFSNNWCLIENLLLPGHQGIKNKVESLQLH